MMALIAAEDGEKCGQFGKHRSLRPAPLPSPGRIPNGIGIALSAYDVCMQPIGYVRSPYSDTKEIPKGLAAKHEAEGVLEIREEFAAGLQDIEGFSHLFVIWVFDRSEGFSLMGTPPIDNQ